MPEEQPDKHLPLLAPVDSERMAIQAEGCALSYGLLSRMVEMTSAQLRESGVREADRVLLLMPNGAEHIIGALAVIAIGAIAVPLDMEACGDRQASVIGQTSPRCCLVTAGIDAPDGIQQIRLGIDSAAGTVSCEVSGEPALHDHRVDAGEHVAFIRFTSGSTGRAKGVMITHAQQLWTARVLGESFGIDDSHRELLLVSMALSGGWQRVAATLHAGGCVVIGETPVSVGDLADMLSTSRATGFFTPPPLVRMLLAGNETTARAALEACRTIEIGSAALKADELAALLSLAPHARVFLHYGLTECSRAVILDAAGHPGKLATVGRPAPGVELRIVDESGRTLPPGREGQVLLRGPQLTAGYWEQPGLNAERFIDGWLVTGDYGCLDDEGFLSLRGRHDDLINCGGHCYFPDEVEHALGTVPGVAHYLVAGVPDPRGMLQEVPWAFVEPEDGDGWTPVAFLAHARKALPAHMVPRQVITVDALPMTPSGKPDRRKTVTMYAPESKQQQ